MRFAYIVLVLAMTAFSQPASAEIVAFLDFSQNGQGVTHSNSGFTEHDLSLSSDGVLSGGLTPNDWVFSYDQDSLGTDSTENSALVVAEPGGPGDPDGGRMAIRDWGGLLTVTGEWTATDDGTLAIFGQAVSVGSDAFNARTEHFTWFYSINNDPAVEFTFTDAANSGTSLNFGRNGIILSENDTVSFGFSINVNGEDDGADVLLNHLIFSAVPEPTSALTFGCCLLMLATRRRNRV